MILLLQVAPEEKDALDLRREAIRAELESGLEIVNAPTFHSKLERQLFYIGGGVSLRTIRDGIRLHADRAVAWYREEEKEQIFEVFAEGHVVFEVGDPAGGFDTLQADLLYIRIKENGKQDILGWAEGVRVWMRNLKGWKSEGDITEWGRGVDRSGGNDIGRVREVQVSAARVEIRGIWRYKATDALVTTCDYGKPHYALHASRVEVDDPQNIHIWDATARVWGVPVLYWPRLFWNMDFNPYVPSIRVGRSSEFGPFAETEWTFYTNDWLRLGAVVDYYEKRGTGFGPVVRYKGSGVRGTLHGYYIEDRGEDELYIAPGEDQEKYRWRGRWLHWNKLPLGVDMFTEYSEESDRNLLPEYFEREFRESKDRESLLYLRRHQGLLGMNFLYKARRNEFDTQVEALPRLALEVVKVPVIDVPSLDRSIHYTQKTDVGNYRFRPDDVIMREGIDLDRSGTILIPPDLGPPPAAGYDFDGDGIPEFIPPVRSWRFDTHHEARLPIPVGPLTVGPYGAWRYTYYERKLVEEEAADRKQAEAGLRLDTQVHRTYDGIRHIVNPSVSYFLRYLNTRGPEGLIPFDQVDTLDETEGITFALRNRLQTRRDPPLGALDRFDFEVKATYFPSRRDPRLRGSWSPIQYDMRINLFPHLAVVGEADQDSVDGNILTWSTGFLSVKPGLYQAGISFRKVRPAFLFPGEDNPRHYLLAGTAVELSEKWGFEGALEYDINDGRPVEQVYSLKRYLHKWVLRGTLAVDEGRDDVSFSVWISLRDLDRTRPISVGRKQDFLGFPR